MQDIFVHVSLDTKATPRETLLPLLLSFEGEKPYAEYASLEEIAQAFATDSKTYQCAAALYAQEEYAKGSIAKCAVVGVDESATDTGVIEALNELRTQSDEWYFLLPVEATDTRIAALAEWTAATLLSETALKNGTTEAEKLLIAQTATKAFSGEHPLAAVVYNPHADTYAHAAWVGRTAPNYPSATTWKWKQLAGIKPCGLTGSALHTLLGRNINAYITNNKRKYMSEGVCLDGEFIDTMIARWQIKQALRADVTGYLVDHEVVPYDNDGFTQIGMVVREALVRAVGHGLILPGFALEIPKREDATRDQAATRAMPPIRWRATLRGGVHGVDIRGVLTVDLTS